MQCIRKIWTFFLLGTLGFGSLASAEAAWICSGDGYDAEVVTVDPGATNPGKTFVLSYENEVLMQIPVFEDKNGESFLPLEFAEEFSFSIKASGTREWTGIFDGYVEGVRTRLDFQCWPVQ